LDDARDNLYGAVRKFLSERAGSGPGKPVPYLALHHRLDRDTSGVLLLVKDAKVNAAAARLFTEHRALKTYHALAERPALLPGKKPQDAWTVRNYLGPAPKRPGGGKRTRYTAVTKGGDPAETGFRLLEVFESALYVQARPKTGRTHQIRVHLSEAGMPILGDDLYGRRDAAPRLMLHAAALVFPHPVTNVEVAVTSPLPRDFRECLERLRDHNR
jgi:23S rRNA pseudouridine955/2504/2580 synthase